MILLNDWLVMLGCLVVVAAAAYATETPKEARFLEDNALRTIMEFTLQSKPPPEKEPKSMLIKPVFLPEKESHGYQQSKPVLATYSELPKQPGSLHTHKPTNFSPYPFFNGGYSAFPLPAQSAFPSKPTTPANYEFKPIYSFVPYPLKEKPAPARPDRYPAPYYFNGYPFYGQIMTPPQTQAPLLAPQSLQAATLQPLSTPLQSLPPQYFAHYTNHPDSSQRLAVGSPSFIIINPASYPTYHYHDSTNRTAARGTGSASDTYSFDEPAVIYDKIDDLESQRSIEHEEDADVSPVQEMEPFFRTAPETSSSSSLSSTSASIAAADDDHLLAEHILAQARASGTGAINSDPLLELLLQRNQLNRRVQERVAAIYFRNYNSNKK